MSLISLKGITWGHSRGYTPLAALAQRFSELHPGVEIEWQKRSLQAFADQPLDDLCPHFDLLVIDHPWVGTAAHFGYTLPLDQHFSSDYLEDQLMHSTGGSHESYHYDGHQWALAIDAAAPAASYRADLLSHPPQTWSEVIDLARTGKVAVPAIPIDLLMTFYSFCIAQGQEPFAGQQLVVDRGLGRLAIESMRELYGLVDRSMFDRNPIAVAELMTRGDDYIYCPFAYPYSNYARVGYARHRLTYTDPVYFGSERFRTTIGGTGLAVSAASRFPKLALEFARFVAEAECQRTMYVQHGGQPGHRGAWTDPEADRLTGGFFSSVLPVMERGYIRPRYHGYLQFQDLAGDPLRDCLMKGSDPDEALDAMDAIYRDSISFSNPSNHP
jgi:multiple sugar transport system substrate-binding protein